MMLRNFHRFIALPRVERRWLRVALFYLPIHRLGVRAAGFRRWHRWLAWDRPARTKSTLGRSGPEASQIALAIERAARRLPGGANCLDRSLTLWWLLHRQGLAADLKFGVRKNEAELEAHAWVEVGGRAINDSEDVSHRYGAFESPILPEALPSGSTAFQKHRASHETDSDPLLLRGEGE
ncbi:MAG: lasso peptide biosynthesis B2 protein [Deltaproteobacteria bacterium]|nr:lasso peptide biosynthesis B2 protein [Deltaproteobacteria bacterium]